MFENADLRKNTKHWPVIFMQHTPTIVRGFDFPHAWCLLHRLYHTDQLWSMLLLVFALFPPGGDFDCCCCLIFKQVHNFPVITSSVLYLFASLFNVVLASHVEQLGIFFCDCSRGADRKKGLAFLPPRHDG